MRPTNERSKLRFMDEMKWRNLDKIIADIMHTSGKEDMPTAPTQPEGCSCEPADTCISLAMAYVPTQKWCSAYEPEVALRRGTMFPELDKPFLGEVL